MDIKDARIDMMVRTKLGKTGKIKEITRDRVVIDLLDGSDYGAAFNCIEPASDLHFAIGDTVRKIGPSEHGFTNSMGHIGKIISILRDEIFECEWGNKQRNNMPARSIEHVSDPCECCQKLFSMNESLEYWRKQYSSACRGATYWRAELEKLQKEALATDAQWAKGEASRFYKQVAPEKLLMSDDAKIICELLESNGPMTSHEIAIRLMIRETCVLESLIEAREECCAVADGKYQIARD